MRSTYEQYVINPVTVKISKQFSELIVAVIGQRQLAVIRNQFIIQIRTVFLTRTCVRFVTFQKRISA